MLKRQVTPFFEEDAPCCFLVFLLHISAENSLLMMWIWIGDVYFTCDKIYSSAGLRTPTLPIGSPQAMLPVFLVQNFPVLKVLNLLFLLIQKFPVHLIINFPVLLILNFQVLI